MFRALTWRRVVDAPVTFTRCPAAARDFCSRSRDNHSQTVQLRVFDGPASAVHPTSPSTPTVIKSLDRSDGSSSELVRRPHYPVSTDKRDYKVFGVDAPVANSIYNTVSLVVLVVVAGFVLKVVFYWYFLEEAAKEVMHICADDLRIRSVIGEVQSMTQPYGSTDLFNKKRRREHSPLSNAKSAFRGYLYGTLCSASVHYELSDWGAEHRFVYIIAELDNESQNVVVVQDNRANKPHVFVA